MNLPLRMTALAIFFAFNVAVHVFAAQPNVILIMSDDQGYGDLGVHGNPIVRTPNLDAMAARSAVLSRFYVSPVCTPTRASLLTGRYNYRTRAIDTFRGRAMMDPAEVTVAELLSKAGYATGIFGKWHLGDCYPMRPIDQGFQKALVHRGGGIGQPSDPPGGEGKYTDPILFHNGEPVAKQGYCTDIYFTEAMRWANKAVDAKQPFFLYLPTNCPHGPFNDVPPEKLAYYEQQDIVAARFPKAERGHPIGKMDDEVQARVYAMIENLDDNVGRLMKWLGDRGLAENTLVIFMTDNGRATPGYNAGMRGNKSTVYEGGIRSPFFAHWPGTLEPGVASDKPAAHIDILPTLLEVCGVEKPADLALDGRSLLPLLKREKINWQPRTLFTQSHRGDKPVLYHNFAARTERWKLVHASGFGREQPPPNRQLELFDMQADPFETREVSGEHPEIVQQLLAEYEAWFADVSATRDDNYAPPRIAVGSPHERTTVLTRQDWRGASWDPKDCGYWEIEVPETRLFHVTAIFEPADIDRKLHLQFADALARAAAPAGSTSVKFDLTLPAEADQLHVWLSEGDAKVGVRFVELSTR